MACVTSPTAGAAALVAAAYASAAAAGALPAGLPVSASAETPRDPAHGDCASAFALAAAGAAGKRPREIAGILLEHMDLTGSGFASVEVAGGGFLNFRLGDGWYTAVLAAVEREGADWGRSEALAGRQVLVETADSLGGSQLERLRAEHTADALAGLLAAQGADVRRSAGEAANVCHAVCVLAAGDRPPRNLPPEAELLTVGPVRLLEAGRPLRDLPPPGRLTGAVPADAIRWYLTAGPGRPAELDLDLAVREDWASTLYRVRYARRRCATLQRLLTAKQPEDADAALPSGESERALLRRLAQLPETLNLAAETLDPGHVSRWLTGLADGFYRLGPVRGGAASAVRARLLNAVRIGLENGLALLGIGA